MSVLKNVSNEEKLKAAKDIVVAYINNSVKKKGEDWSEPTVTPEKVCELLKKVMNTLEEILPITETKIGIH